MNVIMCKRCFINPIDRDQYCGNGEYMCKCCINLIQSRTCVDCNKNYANPGFDKCQECMDFRKRQIKCESAGCSYGFLGGNYACILCGAKRKYL